MTSVFEVGAAGAILTAGTDAALDYDMAVVARTLTVAVVGLGYTGLPLAVGFATAGFSVTGIDLDQDKVTAIRGGRSYLTDITDAELVAAGSTFTATTDPTALTGADVVIVCVPTPVTPGHTADLSYVEVAIDTVLAHLRPGALVVLQSTVPPGTTADVAHRIETRRGLRAGVDYHFAMAPERVDPANTDGWNLATTPKLVGGVSAECTRRAQLLLEQVCRTVVPLSSPDVAELAKVFENTFRLVNIGLVLELSDFCRTLGLPVREVIDAAATKPFGFLPHYPGPGVGGECIPVDPLFLSERARREGVAFGLVDAAHRKVRNRPYEVVLRMAELLAARNLDLRGARVLLVGVSYKPSVADLRNSPALDVVRELRRRGADIRYVDPLVPDLHVDGDPVERVEWVCAEVAAVDCVVLLSAPAAMMTDPGWAHARLVLDTRNHLPAAGNVEVL